MKHSTFERMSLAELWALRQELISILEPKIEIQKVKLEESEA
jgi:hypothetical protein